MNGATEEITAGKAGRPVRRQVHHGGTGRGGTQRRRPWHHPPEFTRRRTLGYRLPEAAAVEQARASLGAGFNRVAVNLNQITRKINTLNRGPSRPRSKPSCKP